MSRSDWTWGRFIVLRDVPDELVLSRATELPPTDTAALTPTTAATTMDTWLRSGRPDSLVVSRIQALVQEERLGPPHPRPAELDRQDLLAMLRAGRLRLYARRLPPPLAPQAREAEQEKPSAPAWEETKTWVAIRLLDDEVPPNPVPFKRYRVELTDGSTREGKLDARGEAYFDGIDPGTCKVTFPDFDVADWRAI